MLVLMSVRDTPLADAMRRFIAATSAAMVLALTVFAASPIAHDWLHLGSGHPAVDDDCAVVLFAGGVSLPLGLIAIPRPAERPNAVSPALATEIFLLSPRYLRQPERGPPALA